MLVLVAVLVIFFVLMVVVLERPLARERRANRRGISSSASTGFLGHHGGWSDGGSGGWSDGGGGGGDSGGGCHPGCDDPPAPCDVVGAPLTASLLNRSK